MQYLIYVPSRSLSLTYNQDLRYNSSNIHALRGSPIESINSIWQRRHSAIQYSIHLCNIQYMSYHGRSAQPITGIYFIDLQIYTLSEDRLLS
ncbi:hypothetical protein GIB67_026246 [Kingdonia uniflora]|uniref:Uncharacterized protein n=1 Tax=Kingdonia uniflora TaxID=39325 RepID=A0A7J7LA52_9MAGN|nr:hypothetical protein GIB67_026246 [Kingdonia uniflora]